MDSVIGQTYGNLEIICVNDCSTDSSLEILKEYALKDKRIKVLNNAKNLGVGLTRNKGIKIAKGDFIHFLDPDDWMELNAYEVLLKYLDKDTDMVRFGFVTHNKNGAYKETMDSSVKRFFGEKIDFYDYPDLFPIFWTSSTWLKIYKKDFITANNLLYNDHHCFSDIEYCVRAAICARNIVFVDDCLINYRAGRTNSLLSERCRHVYDIAKDAKLSAEITLPAPPKLRAAILNFVYWHLILNGLDAYCLNILKFCELRKILEESLVTDVFEESFKESYEKNLTHKVLKYGAFQFFCSYRIRRFLQETFPHAAGMYFSIKKRIAAHKKQKQPV